MYEGGPIEMKHHVYFGFSIQLFWGGEAEMNIIIIFSSIENEK